MVLKHFIECFQKGDCKLIDERKQQEIARRVTQFLRDDIIKVRQPRDHVHFFRANAEDSLLTAQAVFELSTNVDYQNYMGFKNFRGFLWVVNASYYSMFYIARALLAYEGIVLKSDVSIHSLTFDSLVHFFYANNRLQQKVIDAYVTAQDEAAKILGKEKADQMIQDYAWEKSKRATLTYETGEHAIKSKAQTSLKRAKFFNEEIRGLIK